MEDRFGIHSDCQWSCGFDMAGSRTRLVSYQIYRVFFQCCWKEPEELEFIVGFAMYNNDSAAVNFRLQLKVIVMLCRKPMINSKVHQFIKLGPPQLCYCRRRRVGINHDKDLIDIQSMKPSGFFTCINYLISWQRRRMSIFLAFSWFPSRYQSSALICAAARRIIGRTRLACWWWRLPTKKVAP